MEVILTERCNDCTIVVKQCNIKCGLNLKAMNLSACKMSISLAVMLNEVKNLLLELLFS